MKLHPSILTSDLAEFERQIELAKECFEIDVVQVDVLDGFFADNLTLSPLDIAQIDYGDLEIDFHLMVEEPMDYLQEIIGLEKYLPVVGVTAQVERMSHQEDFLEVIKGHGWLRGLSLDLFTPVEAIDDDAWLKVDLIQLMTIEAGFQGQEFNQQALEKISEIREKVGKQVKISVDGGVKEKHLEKLKKADVDIISVGSGLWTAAEPVEEMKKFVKLAS